ncbi:hypothetical protein C8J57DRAFT_1351738 [Mycena rebaudengoi]|nr:hypothetical protein C8J57DRAFT_1351738 [Mycena rebaudengoi]
MPVPQEIVDAIIDIVAMESSLRPRWNQGWNVECHQWDSGPLRACALTCRAFRPRSQKHLFSAIYCFREGFYNYLALFDRLLGRSPHIGLLVRHCRFRLEAVPGDSTPIPIVFSRILSHLPNLDRLDVESRDRQPFPTVVQGALSSLLSMRTLHLCKVNFPSAGALDSLLSYAKSLEHLSLEHITFDPPFVYPNRNGPHPARRAGIVVLLSLTLQHMQLDRINAILAGFKAVDIRHLRYLNIERTFFPKALLAANKQTIQKLRYCFLFLTPGEQLDPNILAGNTSLRSIEIVESNNDVGITLSTFGNLGHLTALRTVSLHFNSSLGNQPLAPNFPATLTQLNTLFRQAGNALEDVRIYAFANRVHELVPDLGTARSWLPSVASKLSVHAPTQLI